MSKAIWNGATIAEAPASEVELVEGNTYFPLHAVRREYLEPSEHHSICPWKGTASYYHLIVDGEKNEDAAWYYPTPKQAAEQIAGHIAFWRGVKIED
jgi:uncharacterized protein (DUF427 family)